MRPLFLIEELIDGGASNVLVDLLLTLPISNRYIFTRIKKRNDIPENITVIEGNANDLNQLFLDDQFDFIHWFRTDSSLLFKKFIGLTKDIKIILTHCQLPSNFQMRLSLEEIKYTTKIVFICNTAYKHSYHQLIAEDKRAMIYFGCSNHQFETPNKKAKDQLIYGRGSTLNKCPGDLIQVFSKFDSKIKFHVAGGGFPERLSQMEKEVKNKDLHDRVKFLGFLNFSEWKMFLNTLDVFFYYIPKNAYSAIDATIQHAMLSELPVLYMGPQAPSELIVHGKTGFIAKSKKELVSFSQQLSTNSESRRKMGEEGKKRILSTFSHEKTTENYLSIYKDLLNSSNTHSPCKIPFAYYSIFVIQKIVFEMKEIIGVFKRIGFAAFMEKSFSKIFR